MSKKTYLCLFLVVWFENAHGTPSGLDLFSQLSESFILAERKFAEEVLILPKNQLPRIKPIMISLDDMIGYKDPNIKIALTNVRFSTRQLPQIISIHLNFDPLKLAINAKVGTLKIQGSFNTSSPQYTSGITGNITMTFENVTGVGFADLTFIDDALAMTDVNLDYKLLDSAVDVNYSNISNDSSLGRYVAKFFSGQVKASVIHELNQQVRREVNLIFKNISGSPNLGFKSTMDDVKSLVKKQEGNLNTFIDSILSKYAMFLPFNITLQDISYTFPQIIPLIPNLGRFLAHEGSLNDIRTLHRTDDIILSMTANGVRISGGMGLKSLNFHYDYEVNLINIGPTGSFEGSANYNSLNFVLEVTNNDSNNCTVHFESLELKDLDGLKVNIKGLGPLNWLVSQITNIIIYAGRQRLPDIFKRKFEEILEKVVNKFELCGSTSI